MVRAIVTFDYVLRRELPALERKGAMAQPIPGELVVVAFHDSRTDAESLSGVSVDVGDKIRQCKAGVPDTIVLASLLEGGVASMLDVFMVKGVDVRSEPWVRRYDELLRLRANMSSEGHDCFSVSELHKQGFMKLFRESRNGLLVRVPGKKRPTLCQEVDE